MSVTVGMYMGVIRRFPSDVRVSICLLGPLMGDASRLFGCLLTNVIFEGMAVFFVS